VDLWNTEYMNMNTDMKKVRQLVRLRAKQQSGDSGDRNYLHGRFKAIAFYAATRHFVVRGEGVQNNYIYS
jgi:hypothetical protein